MIRIETRVTSVQVVQGFPACLAIPNPPGWDWPPSSRPTVPGSPEARIEPHHQPDEGVEGNAHGAPPTPTPSSVQSPSVSSHPTPTPSSVQSPSVSSQPIHTTWLGVSPTPTDEAIIPQNKSPVSSGLARTKNRPHKFGFRHQKLTGENVFINYMISRGDWVEEPPTSLDFSRCKYGPIIYVNEVTEKKVTQIWKWDTTLVRWSSIREGDVFHTARERLLELDRNQVPRLRAVRTRRQKLSASSTHRDIML